MKTLRLKDIQDCIVSALDGLRPVALVILLILFLGCIFEPASFRALGHTKIVAALSCWRIASAALLLTIWLFIGKKDLFVFGGIAFVLMALFSTWLNDGNYMLWGRYWLSYLIVILVSNLFGGKRFRELIWAFFLVTVSISAANALTIMAFPEGLYNLSTTARTYYFFGNRTIAFEFIIPSVTCAFLIDAERKKRISLLTVLVVLLSLYQVFSLESVTCKLVLALLLVLCVLVQFRGPRRALNIGVYVGSFAVAFVAFVVARLGNYLEPIIGGVFNKSLTFSGRTVIWDATFAAMDPSHWLLGFGASGYEHFLEGPRFAWHAHNWILELWMTGGFFSIACVLLMVVVSTRSLFSRRRSKSGALIAAAIACFLLAGLSEPCQACGIFIFLGLGFYGCARENPEAA